VNCFFCKTEVKRTNADVRAVLCDRCVQRCLGAPEIKEPVKKVTYEEKKVRKAERLARKAGKLEKLKTATRGKGRGWHLKKLFHYEGTFYSFGEVIDAAQAERLKKELMKVEAVDPFKVKRGRGRPKKVVA